MSLLFLLNVRTLNVWDKAPVPPGAHTLVPLTSGQTLPPLLTSGGSEASAESCKEELLRLTELTQVSSERQPKPRNSSTNPATAQRQLGARVLPPLLPGGEAPVTPQTRHHSGQQPPAFKLGYGPSTECSVSGSGPAAHILTTLPGGRDAAKTGTKSPLCMDWKHTPPRQLQGVRLHISQ